MKIRLPESQIEQKMNQLKDPSPRTLPHSDKHIIFSSNTLEGRNTKKKENSFTFMGNMTQILLHFRKL